MRCEGWEDGLQEEVSLKGCSIRGICEKGASGYIRGPFLFHIIIISVSLSILNLSNYFLDN